MARNVEGKEFVGIVEHSKLIEGKKLSESILEEVERDVKALQDSCSPYPMSRRPLLVVIIVGNRKENETYVKRKIMACEKCGIDSKVISLPESETEGELIKIIKKFNFDNKVDGLLLQLPLPNHLNATKIIESIGTLKFSCNFSAAITKDVDGLHPENLGRLAAHTRRHFKRTSNIYKTRSMWDIKTTYNPLGSSQQFFIPCTAYGILELLHAYNVSISGKRAVVIGRSRLVGIPVVLLLQQFDATVTHCHSATENLKSICNAADILIVAVGSPLFVKHDWIKNDAVVIDVGININSKGKICGDVDFEEVKNKCSLITPVPGKILIEVKIEIGGVGPMTVAMLMRNTVQAWLMNSDYLLMSEEKNNKLRQTFNVD